MSNGLVLKMAYPRGESRDQIGLLPGSLDDYVSSDAVVRFIDRLVEFFDGGEAYSGICLM